MADDLEEDLEHAELTLRALAYVLDTIALTALVILLMIPVIVTFPELLSPNIGLIGFIAGLITLSYFIKMEELSGQTIGKKTAKIKVVKEDGSECDLRASFIRNILRVIDFIPLYIAGVIAIQITDDSQRIGDIAAGTIVVNDEES